MRVALIILLLSATTLSAGPKLVKTKISEGITVSIPAGFTNMEPDDIVQRIPSVRAPLGAFTNLDRDIDFSVNTSATQWPDANLTVASQFFKSSLMNLYDKVEMSQEGIREIHGKRYIYFELESRMNGAKMGEGQRQPILKYTYIQYLVEKDRTLVFTFNCPGRLKDEWRSTAEQMMKAIRVR